MFKHFNIFNICLFFANEPKIHDGLWAGLLRLYANGSGRYIKLILLLPGRRVPAFVAVGSSIWEGLTILCAAVCTCFGDSSPRLSTAPSRDDVSITKGGVTVVLLRVLFVPGVVGEGRGITKGSEHGADKGICTLFRDGEPGAPHLSTAPSRKVMRFCICK